MTLYQILKIQSSALLIEFTFSSSLFHFLQFKFSPFCPKEKEENTTDETEEKKWQKIFCRELYYVYNAIAITQASMK